MGSVEVDAKIRGEHGATLQERSKYHTRDELQQEAIDLNRLNPDVNGDGKVSASEARIYSLLRKQDTSGDGKLTIGELYKGLEALTKVEKKRSMFTKGFFVMSAVSLIQVLLIVGLITGIVVALKDQFVADNTLTGSSGAILKTAEATEELPLYVLPVLPGKQRGTLTTISISYRDASMHDWMVENGLIGNATTIAYPTVEETAAVLSFTRYNATAADLVVAAKNVGEQRVIRIFNGGAKLITKRADGRVIEASLCAGKVSCASFTVKESLADELRAQATGNLSAIGVDVPADRRLAEDTASVHHRRLEETGDCPCVDGFVLYKGEWVQPTDEEADEAGYVKSDEVGACGCVTWVPKEDARRELFDGDDCEDAADEVVAAVAEVANGIKSCAELKLIGACEHEVAKMHCPASCGLCDELGAERREMGAPRRILGKCR
jgi:hypothetical protein